MKIQSRVGVFETNSSSTHSLTVCTEQEYNDFINGKMLITWGENLVPAPEIKDEVLKEFYDEEKESYFKDWEDLTNTEKSIWRGKYIRANQTDDYQSKRTYKQWCDSDYLERYEYSFTTPSGDKMVAFGKYGYDG